MLIKRTVVIACALLLATESLFVFLPVGQAMAQAKVAAPATPQAKPTDAKLCQNCHQPQPGSLRGNFENVAYKTHSVQIKIDDSVEILTFDNQTLKVAN